MLAGEVPQNAFAAPGVIALGARRLAHDRGRVTYAMLRLRTTT